MRKKLIFSISCLVTGFISFVVFSSEDASLPHYQLTEFYQKLSDNPKKFQGKYMTLYGDVKEGSIERAGIRANFVLIKKNKELNVFFTGKTLLPDTFKDGSQAAVEGIYDQKKQIFIADKVMAKCASRYKSYPEN